LRADIGGLSGKGKIMPDVFRLAYVDLATASLDEAEDYYCRLLGTTVVERTSGNIYLSLGLDHHNIALCRGKEPGNCSPPLSEVKFCLFSVG